MNRSPKIILEVLTKNKGYVDNLYRYLYNPEFYKIAYQNIYQKPSQMTPASDGSTIDGMSMERIDKLISKLRDKSYQPTPLRRVQIPKKNGKTRPISIPSFEDKLVQEVIRMILEALYEHTFSEHSHGFRPKRSCHTALKFTQLKFQGTKWWIDCDIRGCFDNINHQILLKTLAERIKEQKFLALINKFLKAGYIENWQYHRTYSGTPQGSIISSILTNIYLSKFDKYMEQLIQEFWKGKTRHGNPLVKKLESQSRRDKAKYIKNKTEENLNKFKESRKIYIQTGRKQGYFNNYDPEFRRLSYVRYADDFLVGVIASKKEAEEIKSRIQEFLRKELKLELNSEKTKIVHTSQKIKFLGYELSVSRTESRSIINGNIQLWLPFETMRDFIVNTRSGYLINDPKTGKMKLKPQHRNELIYLDEMEILMTYNARIRGLYNYYQMASNVCKMNGFNYIYQVSFLKTLSAKYKTSCAKLYKNINYCQKKHIGITYNNKFYEFFNGPFNVNKNISTSPDIDDLTKLKIFQYSNRTSIIQRMEANKCEWCGSEEGPFEIHHIKKLKDLKGKQPWEKQMIARRRKTMVLCKICHDKLHAGKL